MTVERLATTDVTRRTLLGGSAGLVGLALVGAGTAEAAAASTTGPLRADYAGSIGQIFTATRSGRTYRLRLTHIHDLTRTAPTHRATCFNLVFEPADRTALPDGIYRLTRRGGPTHDLFMSRIGRGRSVQAVVNRGPVRT